MNSEPTNKPTASRQRTRKPTPKPKRKIGRPTKASPERIQGILESIARGLTEEQACAVHDVDQDTWINWKNNESVSRIAFARAKGAFIEKRLALKDACGLNGGDWKRFIFELKCSPGLREQFADVDKAPLMIANQQNNYTITRERAAEIDAQRKRVMALVHGERPVEASYQQPPIREIDHAPLAIEATPEPKRVAQPGDSVRASDMDPLSGVPKPPETEHVRQRDKKPPVGPLSQRQLAIERARRGGDGKRPF